MALLGDRRRRQDQQASQDEEFSYHSGSLFTSYWFSPVHCGEIPLFVRLCGNCHFDAKRKNLVFLCTQNARSLTPFEMTDQRDADFFTHSVVRDDRSSPLSFR